MNSLTSATRLGGKNILRWTLQILVGLAFIAAAAAKMFSVPMMVDVFDHIGFGQWFRYVVAVIELTGGVMRGRFMARLSCLSPCWVHCSRTR